MLGGIDEQSGIPRKLGPYIDKLVQNLSSNGNGWMTTINTEIGEKIKEPVPKTQQMKMVLDRNIDDLSTQDMLMAIVWFSRINHRCYLLDSMEERFDKSKKLQNLCKYCATPSMVF